jgi:hypothetical protein
MMRGRSSLLAWTAVATLSVATMGSTTTEAREFDWSKYCPNSIRSKIEAYVSGRVSSARPKDEEILPPQAGKDDAKAPANPATIAASTVSTTAVPGGNTCLTKQYLATGAVLFKDACTKEWAINSTSVATHRAVGRNCLTKDNSHEAGFVMFKDICTGEWAMNTSERQAKLPESW